MTKRRDKDKGASPLANAYPRYLVIQVDNDEYLSRPILRVSFVSESSDEAFAFLEEVMKTDFMHDYDVLDVKNNLERLDLKPAT